MIAIAATERDHPLTMKMPCGGIKSGASFTSRISEAVKVTPDTNPSSGLGDEMDTFSTPGHVSAFVNSLQDLEATAVQTKKLNVNPCRQAAH